MEPLIKPIRSQHDSGSLDDRVRLTADVPIPGLTAELPISATRLRRLLGCPYRFLLVDLCGFPETPARPPAYASLDAPTLGKLFHQVSEAFSRNFGVPFGRREHTLLHWQHLAENLIEPAFSKLEIPLTRNREKDRLRRDILALLEYDWDQGRPRTFVAAERTFGFTSPVRLDFGKAYLYVCGTIDRLDLEDQNRRLFVRDWKASAWPRRANRPADALLDSQIALYGLVAQKYATQWHLPNNVAVAYVYTRALRPLERAFRSDFSQLAAAAQNWFGVAAELLHERLFPRTPNQEDCAHCPFQPVCGPRAQEQSASLLIHAKGPLARFRDLKQAS